jgi:hypothetical protein
MRPMGPVCPLGAYLFSLGLFYASCSSSTPPPQECIPPLKSACPPSYACAVPLVCARHGVLICPLEAHLCPLGSFILPGAQVHAAPQECAAPPHPCEPFLKGAHPPLGVRTPLRHAHPPTPSMHTLPSGVRPPPTRAHPLVAVCASPPPVHDSCARPPFIRVFLCFIRVRLYFIRERPNLEPYALSLHSCAPPIESCTLPLLKYNGNFYPAIQRGSNVVTIWTK